MNEPKYGLPMIKRVRKWGRVFHDNRNGPYNVGRNKHKKERRAKEQAK